jgi:hypothetical protein
MYFLPAQLEIKNLAEYNEANPACQQFFFNIAK